MGENLATEGSIRNYLAERGGSVEDAAGRGLTDEMARHLGVDKPATLSAILGQMESEGIITREMRGLRTYRIALVSAGDAPPATNGAADVGLEDPVTAVNGPTPGGDRPPPPARAVSLREALAQKGAAPPIEPPPVVPPPVVAPPVVAPPVVAPPETSVEPASNAAAAPPPPTAPRRGSAGGQSPTRVVSLREALGRQKASPAPDGPAPTKAAAPADAAASTDSAAATDAAAPTDGGSSEAVADAPSLDGPPPETPTGTMSLREAIAGTSDGAIAADAAATEAPSRSGRAYSRFSSPSLKAPPSTPPPTTEYPPPAASDTAIRTEAAALPPRRRSRLNVVPVVRTPPSKTIVTAVGAAVAGLVLIMIITIVVIKGPANHPEPAGPQPATDACNIVTPAMASAAFGDNAGPPYFALGECQYEDATGAHQLLIQDFHQEERQVYDDTHTSSAQPVSGIGDAAYYVDGSLWVVKGSSIMELTYGQAPTPTPSPTVLAIAREAVTRL